MLLCTCPWNMTLECYRVCSVFSVSEEIGKVRRPSSKSLQGNYRENLIFSSTDNYSTFEKTPFGFFLRLGEIKHLKTVTKWIYIFNISLSWVMFDTYNKQYWACRVAFLCQIYMKKGISEDAHEDSEGKSNWLCYWQSWRHYQLFNSLCFMHHPWPWGAATMQVSLNNYTRWPILGCWSLSTISLLIVQNSVLKLATKTGIETEISGKYTWFPEVSSGSHHGWMSNTPMTKIYAKP
jgi:hypothetical protein